MFKSPINNYAASSYQILIVFSMRMFARLLTLMAFEATINTCNIEQQYFS